VRDVTTANLINSGAGQTIAVVDSGVSEVPGLAGRVVPGADFTGTGAGDGYGHGTFVASLAAGNGRAADGSQTGIVGVAPAAKIVSVKVADNSGRSTVGQVVAGLAWVVQHRAQYGITVANLSLSEADPSSYLTDPVDALAEAAWFSGMTVVASSGNDGGNVTSAPGNDPYVVTVGSVYDRNTMNTNDDTLSSFSNAGTTADGFAKPEISTFGEHVQAALPSGSVLAGQQTTTGLPAGYGQLSGTSMSTGVAAGAVAVLQAMHPDWSPGRVKGALVGSRSSIGEMRLFTAAWTFRPADVTSSLTPSLALAVAYAQQVLRTTTYSNVVWSNVVWSNVVWSDVVWSDVVWSDVATAVGTAATWSDATWSNATWSNAVWSDAIWSDATWSNTVWSSGLCCDGG
jgi:serine protease AprX